MLCGLAAGTGLLTYPGLVNHSLDLNQSGRQSINGFAFAGAQRLHEKLFADLILDVSWHASSCEVGTVLIFVEVSDLASHGSRLCR